MKVKVADGLRLRVEERGRGPATLLVHGFTGSVEAWGESILDGLVAAGRRVVAVDLPGHGRSDLPAGPRRVTMERLVDDLTAVLDALNLDRADWIGYSMGGRIALGAAVLRPERVDRLVLESASPGLETEKERRARRERDEALARRILDGGIAPFVDEWLALPLFRSRERLPEETRRAERERRLRCDPRGLAAALRGVGTGSQPSFWADLAHLDAPTLLLAGADDPKYQALAEGMAELLPRAEVAVVAEAGHTTHLEAPAEWLRRVGDFLTGR